MTRISMAVTAVLAPATSGCGALPGQRAEPALPDADAGRLAGMALEAWALSRSATGYELHACSRPDRASARCVARIQFADNPVNPRMCSLGIAVWATTGRVGVKEDSPSAGLEIEDYPLSNGGYGTYRYGDESACDQAQYLSGF